MSRQQTEPHHSHWGEGHGTTFHYIFLCTRESTGKKDTATQLHGNFRPELELHEARTHTQTNRLPVLLVTELPTQACW